MRVKTGGLFSRAGECYTIRMNKDVTRVVSSVNNDIKKVKSGLRTTEFYLSTFVALSATIIQFVPSGDVHAVVKAAALVSAGLAAVGYTASRTIVKK